MVLNLGNEIVVGSGLAAGSAITENVPAGALGLARSRPTNQKGWAAKKRRELAASDSKKGAGKKSRKRRKSRR